MKDPINKPIYARDHSNKSLAHLEAIEKDFVRVFLCWRYRSKRQLFIFLHVTA